MAGHNPSTARFGHVRRQLQRLYAAGTTTTIAATRRAPAVRFASSSTTSSTTAPKTRILEKPAKFNPPSHGAKLPRGIRPPPQVYGGDLSQAEVKIRNSKHYPGLMAPEGSLAYRMWHSKALHLCLTLGTLLSLAGYTFVQNFQDTSPYLDMVPAWSDFFRHPYKSTKQLIYVVRLTEAHNSSVVLEKRLRAVNDVAKRKEYKKAHGLDQTGLPWLLGKKEEPQVEAASETSPTAEDSTTEAKAPRKKWLGIF